MTSRQDLLEAQAWARRRVLASLVSGGEEPEAPGRALLGGTAIAVVVALVVAAIALVG